MLTLRANYHQNKYVFLEFPFNLCYYFYMILLDQVTKTYRGDARPALDHISLHIEPNEFVFLVGKSGAGKSTLMKMITKEEVPDAGKIIIGGIDLDYVKKRYIPHYRRRLGVVFQDFKLLPGRTVYENVAFALEIAGMSNKEISKTVPKVLDLVGLSDAAKKFPRELSGGMAQRVSIARSVARQPKILIADEPTGNLDKITRKEIIELLQKINDFGTTVLVTTHDENIVNNLQKRVVTLKDGRIVADQKINGIYRLDVAAPAAKPRVIRTPGSSLQPASQTVKRAFTYDPNAYNISARPTVSTSKVSVPKAAPKTIAQPAAKATTAMPTHRSARPATTPANVRDPRRYRSRRVI